MKMNDWQVSRRNVLQLLFAILVWRSFPRASPDRGQLNAPTDDYVIINGWVLHKQDLLS